MTARQVRRCRRCDAPIRYAGKGRPRSYCPDCSPPGTKHPDRISPDFPRPVVVVPARARHAARAAAARAVARRHRDEYETQLAAELAKRGVS